MKVARIFAAVFAAVGMLLMVGTMVLCLVSLDAPVEMVGMPKEAMACAEEMMDALAAGDFAAAANRMYGQPDLGAGGIPDDAINALVWDAFVSSISYEFVGVCYAEDSGIYRDAAITALDIPSVTAGLQTRANALMAARTEVSENADGALEESTQSREALAAQVLQEAVDQALREDALLVTRNVTLKLIHRDGRWWVVPDQALLQAISGGVA